MLGEISKKEIEELLERYAIGKKPLARLLGWGDVTIIRYLSGDQPTMEYARRLREIYERPDRYLRLLSDNQEVLTGVAFRKSREAVYRQIFHSKLRTAAGFLMEKWGRNLSGYEVGCFMFYLQTFWLSLQGKCFYEEEFILKKEEDASPDGPFSESDIFMMQNLGRLLIPENILKHYFSQEEIDFMENLYAAFSWYGEKTIATIWEEDRQMVKKSRDKENHRIISRESMEHYLEGEIKDMKDMRTYLDRRFRRIRGWDRLSDENMGGSGIFGAKLY